ncbi:MAG: hypothetical protein BZY80_02730 [SAR202 cluster bacterium Io17-Chloro-G2]|nr:MAG: hypothetical protein BZY80_02730 [SAR202 cluster bacterium Io17-Chloro-G2]
MPSVRITFLGTGAGESLHRAHTAITLDAPDGTRVLLDASSGNSVMRNATLAGMEPKDFCQLLLSHDHADHMSGLPLIQTMHTRASDGGDPIQVHCSSKALENLKLLFQATSPGMTLDHEGLRNSSGRQVVRWTPIDDGQQIGLGPNTSATRFPVDHIDQAMGWRVECGGVSIVFSGDTKFSPSLVDAAKGARLLIHEAYGTETSRELAEQRGHSPAADAGRAAALAGVEELILTHITNAYHIDPQPLVDEARQYFDGPVSVAYDLYQVTVD